MINVNDILSISDRYKINLKGCINMSKKVYILQKEVKRGSKLCWECEDKSYNYDEVEGKAILKDTQHNNYRIKTITE